MELEIVPTPSDEERAAIEAALAALLDDEQADAWWAAGLPRDEDGEEDV